MECLLYERVYMLYHIVYIAPLVFINNKSWMTLYTSMYSYII